MNDLVSCPKCTALTPRSVAARRYGRCECGGEYTETPAPEARQVPDLPLTAANVRAMKRGCL